MNALVKGLGIIGLNTLHWEWGLGHGLRNSRGWKFVSPQYFGITRRYMQKKLGNFYFLTKISRFSRVVSERPAFGHRAWHLPLCRNIGGKQIFSLGSFPKVGQKQKTEKKEEREREKDSTIVITMASYALQTPPRVAHANHLGQY